MSLGQVTFISIVLYTKLIVSKQLHINNQENNSVNVVEFS